MGLLLLFSLVLFLQACSGEEEPRSQENATEYNPYRRVYNVTGGFRNPYHATNYKNVEPEKDAKLSFPTELGKVLFTSLDEFKEVTHDGLHPYAFQFLEKDVKEVLGPAFDLARSIVMDPLDMVRVKSHNDWLMGEPLARLVNTDCMTRCPNPDVYEPYQNPFLEMVGRAARAAGGGHRRRRGRKGSKRQKRPRNPLASMINRIPKKESLKQHDANQFLGTAKLPVHEQFLHDMGAWSRDHQNVTGQLQKRFDRAWKKMDHAEMHELEELMDEADAEIEAVLEEMELAMPGGPMWRTSNDHMWASSWDMNHFDRYLKYTPGVIEPLSWFLDNYPAPFHNSGKFYYPPGGTRQWHTNVYSGGVGWRAYIVRKWPAGARSGTNVMHPNSGSVFEIPDHDDMAINIFRINDMRAPLWHCVYSDDAHRFSLGMKFADEDVFKILTQTGVAVDESDKLDGIADKWNAKYDKELKRINWNDEERKRHFKAMKRLEALQWQQGNLTLAYVDLLGGEELADQIVDAVGAKIGEGMTEKIMKRVHRRLEGLKHAKGKEEHEREMTERAKEAKKVAKEAAEEAAEEAGIPEGGAEAAEEEVAEETSV